MIKRSWAALLLAAALCLVVAAPVAAKDPVRPFGGSLVGADSAVFNPTDCPAGSPLRYLSEGTGQVLHLGLIHYTVTHCVFMDSAVDGHIGPGTVTITAANGDMLVLAETSGTFKFDQPMPDTKTSAAQITWVVASGTGRFADATGSGTGAGVGDMVALITPMVFTGTISY